MLSFEKASDDPHDKLDYSIIKSDGLVGFPTFRQINEKNAEKPCHAARQVKDDQTGAFITTGAVVSYLRVEHPKEHHFTKKCSVFIKGNPTINTGADSYLMIRNDGPGTMLLHVEAPAKRR